MSRTLPEWPMRKLVLLVPCVILCGGLGVAPFDSAAVPKAIDARQAALKACATRTDFKSNNEVLDCLVAADQGFATAIHLRDSVILTSYTGRVKALESDIDKGAVKPADIMPRFHDAQNEFFKAVKDRYADYQADMAQDTAHDMNDAAQRAQQQMRSMDDMNGMGGMNGMGN